MHWITEIHRERFGDSAADEITEVEAMLDAALSAGFNVLLLGVVPLGIYAAIARRRWGLSNQEIRQRLGLVVGDRRLLAWTACLVPVAAGGAMALASTLSNNDLGHERSPLRGVLGEGLNPYTVAVALLHGVIQTGLAEELLFRGLIAGALGRRMSPWRANLVQTAIFLVPHLAVVAVAPHLWRIVLATPIAGGLLCGWLRLRSGSILAPWMVHAAGNVATMLAVAART
jgi:membrane protease YdiL (CAAX protease family)